MFYTFETFIIKFNIEERSKYFYNKKKKKMLFHYSGDKVLSTYYRYVIIIFFKLLLPVKVAQSCFQVVCYIHNDGTKYSI